MKFEAIEVYKVSGNKDEVLSEQRIIGPVELVPMPTGRAYLMLPMDYEKREDARKRGLMEAPPLSKWDLRERRILELSKAESIKAFSLNPGDEITIIRKSWGRTWNHKVRRMA